MELPVLFDRLKWPKALGCLAEVRAVLGFNLRAVSSVHATQQLVQLFVEWIQDLDTFPIETSMLS